MDPKARLRRPCHHCRSRGVAASHASEAVRAQPGPWVHDSRTWASASCRCRPWEGPSYCRAVKHGPRSRGSNVASWPGCVHISRVGGPRPARLACSSAGLRKCEDEMTRRGQQREVPLLHATRCAVWSSLVPGPDTASRYRSLARPASAAPLCRHGQTTAVRHLSSPRQLHASHRAP